MNNRNWPVVAVSAAGAALAAALGVTKLTSQALPFCAAGEGCDVVQASRGERTFSLVVGGFLVRR